MLNYQRDYHLKWGVASHVFCIKWQLLIPIIDKIWRPKMTTSDPHFHCLKLQFWLQVDWTYWYIYLYIYMGLSENSVPLHPMVLLIIIPTKWLFHWGYTPFSDIPISILNNHIMQISWRSVPRFPDWWSQEPCRWGEPSFSLQICSKKVIDISDNTHSLDLGKL